MKNQRSKPCRQMTEQTALLGERETVWTNRIMLQEANGIWAVFMVLDNLQKEIINVLPAMSRNDKGLAAVRGVWGCLVLNKANSSRSTAGHNVKPQHSA